VSLTDRRLKHLWRQYLANVVEASRIAKSLGVKDSVKLDEFASVAKYNIDVISKRIDADTPAWDQIKGVIGSG
jgi:hypothetical protein